MKIFCTSMYIDLMNFAEILKHPVKKLMFIRSDHSCVMRPHQYIGIIAANDTLSPYQVCYFIKQSFIINP